MIYFAWVDLVDGAAPEFSAVHEVEDEQVFGFEVTHSEGDFPQLSLIVKNPNGGLLAPGRKRWAWLSRDTGGGAVPLFFGRLVGMPEGIDGETYQLLFIARAKDWAAQKSALADTLRVLPYYDPVWIGEDSRDDPDTVLEARSALWHTDRITGAMTVSDYLVGEDGTEALTHFQDNFDVRFVTNAARRVSITAEAAWEQQGVGSVDISRRLTRAFGGGTIQTFTGEGLVNSWPQVGTNIGGGWSVGDVRLRRVDRGGFLLSENLTVVVNSFNSARFPLWKIAPTMKIDYAVSRAYSEKITLSLSSDLQPLLVNIDEEEPIEINLSTSSVGEPIDGTIPIGDLGRRSYFQSDRGAGSISYLLERARAVLRAEARAVDVSAEITFEQAAALSCRKSATITDERLPGGSATGKVVAYAFGIDGQSGVAFGRVTIGCSVGTGATVTFDTGTPAYADDYALAGWQVLIDSPDPSPTGDTAWTWNAREIMDDGIDINNLDPSSVIVTVTNGPDAQRAAMVDKFTDLAAAGAKMNSVATKIKLEAPTIDNSGFVSEYDVTAINLILPKTIDLEAA